MSATVRAEISNAASEVVICKPYGKQPTAAGQAVVRYAGTTYPDRFGGLVTWEVVVALSTDLATAEKYVEENTGPLVAALADVMTVRRAYPATGSVDGTQTNLLVIEGTREED